MLSVAKKDHTISLYNHLLDEQIEKDLKKSLLGIGIQVEAGLESSLSPGLDLSSYQNHAELSVEFLIEEVLRHVDFNFEELPFLLEGESKILRKFNDYIVVELFKPTVYSYTQNRYGVVDGTDTLRAKFTAQVFREMHKERNRPGGKNLNNAFLASKETDEGIYIFQRLVEPSNLEVRVKRYHVGSPVHRYKYTDRHPTVTAKRKPLEKWDRFDKALVCFDWRNPLTDDEGNRLADEPISDDYASVWISDVTSAKRLARETFEWLEGLFGRSGLVLIDICFFIDESGQYVFGEISPDCMRVREGVGHPKNLDSYDKDLWRKGEKEAFLAQRYNRLYELIFNH